MLQYFAMERFLYRLARSKHADKFVLKVALMFTAWGAPASRPTKDIDLLAHTDNAVEAVTTVMREVCVHGKAVQPLKEALPDSLSPLKRLIANTAGITSQLSS